MAGSKHCEESAQRACALLALRKEGAVRVGTEVVWLHEISRRLTTNQTNIAGSFVPFTPCDRNLSINLSIYISIHLSSYNYIKNRGSFGSNRVNVDKKIPFNLFANVNTDPKKAKLQS